MYEGRPAGRNLTAVQRLYSMFPQGLPGIALLSLRLSIALPLFMQMQAAAGPPANWLLWSSIGIGAALLAGILTPIAAILAVVAWRFKSIESCGGTPGCRG